MRSAHLHALTWEQRRLSELSYAIKDGTHGTHLNKPMSGYFLLSAKNLKNGKVMMSHDEREITKEDYALIEKSFKIQKGDVLLSIVGTIGEVVEVQNTLNMVFQRSVAMIRPRKSIISSRFLSYALAISNFKKYLIEHQSVSAQPGIYLGDLLKAHIIFPSLSEQQRIGQFFKDLDTLITLHQRKCDQLKNIKKSLLEKLFPKNGTLYPELRFKGFTDAWEQCKLDEITNRVLRKNKNLESELPLTISAQEGLVDQEKFFNKRIASKDLRNYLLVENGEFAYNKSYSSGYPWGVIKRLDKYPRGVVSSLYIVFSPILDKIDSSFLVVFFESELWHSQISKRAAEGARNHGLLNIQVSDFFDIDLTLSSLSEQHQIGQFFKDLDNLITLHQRKVEKLKKVKASLLEKMFV